MAEAFCRHRFEETFGDMDGAITWTLVGEGRTEGKAEVIAICEESAMALADVETTFRRFRVIDGGDTVVVASEADYRATDGELSRVASCDIFDFSGGSLRAITSFTAELPASE